MFGSRFLVLSVAACMAAGPALAAGFGATGASSLAAGLTIMGALFVLGGAMFVRRRAPGLSALAVMVVAVMCAASVAMAQEVVTQPPSTAPSTVISLGPLWATISELILAALGTVVAWALAAGASALKKSTGIQLEQQWQTSLHSAAMTGVTSALSFVKVKADAMTIDVKNQVVADAVNWVIKSVPDAVNGLGASPEKIRTIVESKLGVIQQATPAVEVANTAPHA